MFLKSVINMCDPLVHWTGENFSPGATGNVYDEYGNNPLLNQNATLGEAGQDNLNYSSKSFNVKGGHLIVADGSFLNAELAARDFMLIFSVKTDGVPVGTLPLISKWVPEQSFWIGFENNLLTMKFQTGSGILSFTVPDYYMPVVCSGRWAQIAIRVRSGYVNLYVNGANIGSFTSSAPFDISIISPMTIGSPAPTPFTQDVFINDVFITRQDNDYVPLMAYKMPRSDREIWMDLNPDYLFFVADSFEIDPLKPIPNDGHKGGYGYLMRDGGTDPYMSNNLGDRALNSVHIGANSWFTIDDDILMDPATLSGFTLMFDMQIPTGDGGSGTLNDKEYRYMDLRQTATDYTDGFILSDERYNSIYHWIGHEFCDGTGSVVHQNARADGLTGRASWFDSAGIFRFHFNQTHLNSSVAAWPNPENTQSITDAWDVPLTWTQPSGYNRFLWNNNTNDYDWSRVRVVMLSDNVVPMNQADVISRQRTWIMTMFIRNHGYGVRAQLPGWSDYITPTDIRDWKDGPTFTMSYMREGYSYVTNDYDALANRQNELPSSIYLYSVSAVHGQHGGSYGESNNKINAEDFTLNVFIHNTNTTSRYLFLTYSYNMPTSGTGKGSPQFTIYMNSREGVFSHGDIEWVWEDNVHPSSWVNYTSSGKFTSDGYHMLTFSRKGTDNILYIDGILDTVVTTPSIHDCGTTARVWRFFGGPVYFTEFTWWLSNVIPHSMIEGIFRGYSDVVKGKTLLNGLPLESRLLAIQHDTGRVINTDYSDENGDFEFQIPKDSQQRSMDIVALPADETATNHVVVHGPYNANTTYTRYVDEDFNGTLKDMIIDFQPLVYYPLDDDGVGAIAHDASGNGTDAAFVGTFDYRRSAPNSELYSVEFDGTTSYIDMPDGFDDFSEGLTIEFWVYEHRDANSFASWEEYVNMSYGAEGVNEIRAGRYVNTSSFYFDVDGGGAVLTESNNSIITYLWRHVVMRIKKDFTKEIWVDGNLSGSVSVGGLAVPNVLRTLNYIGRGSHSSDKWFDGHMSNVAIYDHALSTEEIGKHHRRGKGYSSQTLYSTISVDEPVYYWTFDRLSGLTDSVSEVDMVATGTYAIEKNAMVLNGGVIGNNYLTSAGTHVMPGTAGGWTIEVCTKIPGGTQTDAIVVGEWDEGNSVGTWKLQIDSSNNFKLVFGTDATFLQSSTVYNDGLWHHIIVTYDGDIMFLWVDGVAEASVSVALSTYSQHNLTVGNDSSGSATHFFEARSEVDDLAIYNHTLSDVRIAEHYTMFQSKKDTL